VSTDEPTAAAPPTVFLSYASEDRAAARAIGDALPGYGLEVWYDESELGGGDAWDQKIRKQIRECDYFMALVSAQTEARNEGYFRREWRLAVERTLDMADDHLFLLPVVIDETAEAGARVPDKFLAVQWLRVPGGRPTPALESLCRRLVSGGAAAPVPAKRSAARRERADAKGRALQYPEFPRHEPGQNVKYWVEVLGWAFRSAWTLFRRSPRWIRILAIVWIGVFVASKGCTPSSQHESSNISPAAKEKLKAIADQYHGGTDKAAIAGMAAQVAHEFIDVAKDAAAENSPVLAIPFASPKGDTAAEHFAGAAFAQVYGRVAISHHGHVMLTEDPVPACDVTATLERGRVKHASYVLCGSIGGDGGAQALTISVTGMADGAVRWAKSYPIAGADPAKIAAEVDSKVPVPDDD
jgi:TIR domain